MTAGDYSVQVKGFPRTMKTTDELFKHFSQFGEVAEVHLARIYNDLLDDYKKRAQLSFELGYQKLKLK